MKSVRHSVLLSLGLIVMACLLSAAVEAGVPADKKCYDAGGNEIPCPQSNYRQTQQAGRAAGPSSTPVTPTATPSPTASPTATPTATATSTETPAPSATPKRVVAPPAASAPRETSSPPWAGLLLLIPVLGLGCAGLVVVILAVLIFRWLSSRRNPPPGPPANPPGPA